jgi:heme-degrading monooxygenase HmoA
MADAGRRVSAGDAQGVRGLRNFLDSAALSACHMLLYANPGDHPMFIAMNRFRVAKGSEAAFEHVWLSRDSHLDKVPGFVEFHLLKGPEAEDHTLYASHAVWKNRAAFEAWTQSEAFRAAHHRAGENKPLYLGHPQFEGFEVRQTVGRGEAQVA